MFEDKLHDMDWETSTPGQDKPLTEFEKMLAYHEMDRQDWDNESGNEQGRLWWNYRRFGRKNS